MDAKKHLHILKPVIYCENPEAKAQKNIVELHPVGPASGSLHAMKIQNDILFILIIWTLFGLDKPSSNFVTAIFDEEVFYPKI